ncbi:protein CFAP20DC-like isoform X2 [Patiria miniata]|uniref:CFA20 domain-containing protein n=1 Tax=Patiria miniata TaxID=46514 RepID=A0A914AY00_PATMI|nr:protein CFAP20DC-like isoform X2 [Patiria miniata]
MFKSEFQGGAYVEVFSCQGKEPLAKWKLTGAASIHKVYEKEAKSFVHVLEGAGTSTKIQLPKDVKQTLALVQRFLVLQVFVPLGQDFSIELGVSDMGNNKRRLLFSTAQKEIAATPLHAKIPLTVVRRAMWLNLCIDLVSMVSEAFRLQTYKSLDSLIVCASCHLRKVFTMKTQPPDDTDDDDQYDCNPPTNNMELDSIPRSCQFSADVSCQTQVLNMNKLRHAEFKLKPDSRPGSSTEPLDLNSSMKGRRNRPTHIAFGSKVPVPAIGAGKKPASAGSQREGSESASSRSSRSSHSRALKQEGDPLVSDRSVSAKKEVDRLTVHSGSRQRQASDPGTEVADLESRVDKGTLKGSNTWSAGLEASKEDNFVQPHPPRQKSGDKSRRVVKVRPNSGKRERGDSMSAGSDTSTSGRSGHYDRSRYADNGGSGAQRRDSEESSDADRPSRVSDAAILKYASSRIKAGADVNVNGDESKGSEKPMNKNGNHQGVRPTVDSLSESDELAGRSNQKGRTQRRKKKADRPPPLSRMDSLSESEEGQRQRGKGRSHGDRGEGGGGVARSGRPEKREGGGSSRMEQLSDISTTTDSGVTDLHSAATSRGAEESRDQTRPKPPNTSRHGNKQSRAEGNKSSNDPLAKGNGKIYTFTSPPRSAPLRPIERSRHLEPKKLQLQKISEGPPRISPTPPPADDDRPSPRNSSPSDRLNGEGGRTRYNAIFRRTPSPRQIRSLQLSSSGEFSDHKRNDVDSPKPTASMSPQQTRKSLLTASALQSHSRASAASPARGSLSRLSIHSKKLREIPKDDPRLSDDYDWMKYQSNNSSLASSLEANMLASLRRQQLEEMYEEDPNDERQQANNSFDIHNYGDDDLSSSSDDTATTYSTFKPPKAHRYQDEMHFPSNTNPLTQSNPRDWSNLFSPPIVLPSEKIKADHEAAILSPGKDMPTAFRTDKARTKSTSSDDPGRAFTESEEDEELDLLYDPCLNCYYDPRTGKYYELK